MIPATPWTPHETETGTVVDATGVPVLTVDVHRERTDAEAGTIARAVADAVNAFGVFGVPDGAERGGRIAALAGELRAIGEEAYGRRRDDEGRACHIAAGTIGGLAVALEMAWASSRERDEEIARLREALRTGIFHIEHMASWIGKQNGGYSFEGLGEDIGDLRDALIAPARAALPEAKR